MPAPCPGRRMAMIAGLRGGVHSRIPRISTARLRTVGTPTGALPKLKCARETNVARGETADLSRPHLPGVSMPRTRGFSRRASRRLSTTLWQGYISVACANCQSVSTPPSRPAIRHTAPGRRRSRGSRRLDKSPWRRGPTLALKAGIQRRPAGTPGHTQQGHVKTRSTPNPAGRILQDARPVPWRMRESRTSDTVIVGTPVDLQVAPGGIGEPGLRDQHRPRSFGPDCCRS